MINKIKQFRYYGDDNANNYPKVISGNNLNSGSIFFSEPEQISIMKIGIQAFPGAKIYINGAVDPMIIGPTGFYELDLNNTVGIMSLAVDKETTDFINSKSNTAYLIVDTLYS